MQISDRVYLLVFCMAVNCMLMAAIPEVVRAENDGTSSSVVDLYDLPASKRPYFISPRVGRSYWNSDKGLSDDSRPIGGPLLLLLTNTDSNHRLGTRASSKMGYIPQARIGRRAQPTGLMPMPRVGRSDPSMRVDLYEPLMDKMNLFDDTGAATAARTTPITDGIFLD